MRAIVVFSLLVIIACGPDFDEIVIEGDYDSGVSDDTKCAHNNLNPDGCFPRERIELVAEVWPGECGTPGCGAE